MAFLTLSLTLGVLFTISFLFLTAISAAYFYTTRKFNYWTKKGVPESKPKAFFGNFAPCCFFQKPFPALLRDIYFEHEGRKEAGFFIFDKPCLLARDLNLINRIMVKDFHIFPNRYVSASDHDPLGSANLFVIHSPHWKTLRTKLSPTMTSGKLKKMFQLMVSVGKDLDNHLKSLNLEGEGGVVEMREIWAKFTTDIIATCAYGIRANSLNNPDAEFRKCGKKIFEFNFRRSIEFTSIFLVPDIVKPLGFMFFEKSCSDFLRRALWDTLTQRMESGTHRNDLIDTLIELKNSQSQADKDDPDSFKFDGDNLTAQAAIFFTGGFDTSSSVLNFTLHELALHQDIQSKLREEITTALEENGEEVQYEWVTQLPYLDMVISEVLRKYPIVGHLDRVAISDYKVPDSDLVIEKGTPVFVSTFGIHHDPKYYPDPEKFDPERFNNENKQKLPSHAYMPFGDGPRNCVGLRFGKVTVKLALVKTISSYTFSPCKDTTIPLRLNSKSILTAMEGGLLLNVRKIVT